MRSLLIVSSLLVAVSCRNAGTTSNTKTSVSNPGAVSEPWPYVRLAEKVAMLGSQVHQQICTPIQIANQSIEQGVEFTYQGKTLRKKYDNLYFVIGGNGVAKLPVNLIKGFTQTPTVLPTGTVGGDLVWNLSTHQFAAFSYSGAGLSLGSPEAGASIYYGFAVSEDENVLSGWSGTFASVSASVGVRIPFVSVGAGAYAAVRDESMPPYFTFGTLGFGILNSVSIGGAKATAESILGKWTPNVAVTKAFLQLFRTGKLSPTFVLTEQQDSNVTMRRDVTNPDHYFLEFSSEQDQVLAFLRLAEFLNSVPDVHPGTRLAKTAATMAPLMALASARAVGAGAARLQGYCH